MLALCPIFGQALAIMTVAGWEIVKLGLIVTGNGPVLAGIGPWIGLCVWGLAFQIKSLRRNKVRRITNRQFCKVITHQAHLITAAQQRNLNDLKARTSLPQQEHNCPLLFSLSFCCVYSLSITSSANDTSWLGCSNFVLLCITIRLYALFVRCFSPSNKPLRSTAPIDDIQKD